MKKIIKEDSKFWGFDDRGKVKIINTKLLAFLESEGFANAKISETDHILISMVNNRVSQAEEAHVDQIIRDYLLQKEEFAVYETYVKGMGNYVSKRKFNLLKSVELIDDRDPYNLSMFFFQNCFCEVTAEGIAIKEYEDLKMPIWNNRLIKWTFKGQDGNRIGQFEVFCRNITGRDDDRFLAFKTMIGYLLHRNKEVGESRAIILYDENMGLNNEAHGGTGKSLLGMALSKCREVEIFDGKEIKKGSWFKNQRIQITTDILIYDDLNPSVSLEHFYTMITQGVEVEKKRKQAYYIDAENAPKIMISSNYPVKGPGGPSDERRRHEFELSNYYSDHYTPEMEFGNRFFGQGWPQEEWNMFYQFMMCCIQEFLKNGLIKIAPINLAQAKLNDQTCTEFVAFADEFVEFGNWQDKRIFEDSFRELHPEYVDVSSHMLKKWLDFYAAEKGSTVEIKSSAGNYFFRIRLRKEVQDA